MEQEIVLPKRRRRAREGGLSDDDGDGNNDDDDGENVAWLVDSPFGENDDEASEWQ